VAKFFLTFAARVCYNRRTIVLPTGFGAVPHAWLKGKKVKTLRCPATVKGDEPRTMPLEFSGKARQVR
jgi:hypothetical protein